jgi:D-lactate dehydrogenase
MALGQADVRLYAPPAQHPWGDRAPDWVAGGTPEPLRGELLRALGPGRVATRALDLIRYASDASPYRSIPRAVAIPREVEDVRALLALARRTGTPVVFGRGSCSSPAARACEPSPGRSSGG